MSQIKTRRNNVYCLALCAVLIAMSFALNQIKIINMPYGGSITLFSMLAATLTGYFCGPRWGIISGVSLGLIDMAVGGVLLYPAQIILDYFLGFGALGLSGLFTDKKYGLHVGYMVAVTARFVCSFISGFIFFGAYAPEAMNPVLYSFLYNAFYIFGEAALTLIVLSLAPVKNSLRKLKQQMIR